MYYSFILLTLVLLTATSNCSEDEELNKCGINCQQCVYDQDLQLYICQMCKQNYQINDISNQCEFTQCPKGLFKQETNDGSIKCVLLCDNLQIGNKNTNTCESIFPCNTFLINKEKLMLEIPISQIVRFKGNQLIIAQRGFYTIINESGIIQKTIQMEDDIFLSAFIKGYLFIIRNNNLYLQDLLLESKKYLRKIISTQSTSTQFGLINSQMVCVITIDSQKNTIEIQPVYDISTHQESQIMSQILDFSQYLNFQVSNDLIIANQYSGLMISQIQFGSQIKISKSIICSQIESNGKIEVLINFENSQEYIIGNEDINSQTLFYINLNNTTCNQVNLKSIIESDQIINKITTHRNQTSSFLLLTQDNIYVVQCPDFLIIQQINMPISEDNYINILQIHINQETNYLVGLTLKNNLVIFQYNNGQYQYLQNIFTQQIPNINLIIKVEYYEQQSNDSESILLQSQSELQVLQFKENQQLQYVNLINYSLPSQIISGNVQDMKLIESASLLVTCLQSGYILIYDISSGFQAILINNLYFSGEYCKKIEIINGNQIIALLKGRIVLINLYTGENIADYQFNQNQSVFNDISVNGIYSLLFYDNCIIILQNGDIFTKILQDCQIFDNQNIQSVKLDKDLQIVAQSQYQIQTLQLLPQKQSFIQLKTIYIDQSISYFKYITIRTPTTDSINDYEIEELLIYDSSRNFFVYNNELIQLYQINIPLIKIPSEIKRTKNDSQLYFMIENQFTNNQYQHNIVGVKKGISNTIIWKGVGFENSPYIDDPIKYTSDNGIEYYLIRQYLLLGFVTVIKDLTFSLQFSSTNYVYGHGFVIGDNYQQNLKIEDQRYSNGLSYIGTQQGNICFFNNDYKRYQTLSIIKFFQTPTELIIKILQFQMINKYFILTSSQILIFNIHTDQLEDQILLQESVEISIIEDLSGLMISNSSSMILRIYSYTSLLTTYSYHQTQIINKWIFNSRNKMFYVYGDGLAILDRNLNVQDVIMQSNKFKIQSCAITVLDYLCVTNSSQLVIYNILAKQITINNITGFSSTSILIAADFKYSNIFLIQDYLQIYSLKGIFNLNINFTFKNIIKFTLIEDYAIVLSPTSILKRTDLSFYAEFQSPSGFHLLGFKYIPLNKQIIYFCDNTLFAQLFIIDISSKQLIGKIQQYFPTNGNGVIKQVSYDEYVTNINYLDEYGNFYVVLLNGALMIQGNTKILEIVESGEKPIGYSIDYKYANILVYTQKNVYKINYNLMSDKYQFIKKTSSKMFTIVQNQMIQNNINNQVFLLGGNNYLYKYENQQLQFESKFQEEILEIRFSERDQILILAFQNYIYFYLPSPSGQITTHNRQNVFTINQFSRFIEDNIFLTKDGRFIHFDFINNKILFDTKLPINNIITSIYSHSSLKYTILGFNDGLVIIYSKLDYLMNQYYDIQLSTTQNIKKQIKFVIEITSDIILISSIQGQIIKIENLKVIENSTIQDLINLDVNQQQFLNNLVFDKSYSRIIFSFYRNKHAYVFNTITNILDGFINTGNTQNNHVTISDAFIVASSSHQLNFYTRQGDLKYIGSIIGNTFFDEITQFIIVKTNYVFIFYLDKYKVYYFSEKQVHLIEVQQVSNPTLIQYNYDENTNSILIVGLSVNGVFQSTIVINNKFNQVSSYCGMNIDTNDVSSIKNQITMIEEEKKEILVIGGITLTKSENASIILFIDIISNQIQLLYNILKNSEINNQKNIIFSSQNINNPYFIVNNNTFDQIDLVDWNFKNLKIMFTYDNQIINFNNKTKSLQFQNIAITKQTDLKGNRFNFVNLEQVVFQNFTLIDNIQNLENNRIIQSNQINKEEDNYFFYFENVERVYFYGFTVNGNNMQSLIFLKQLLYLKNVKEVIIEDLKITNNYNLGGLFKFENIEKLIIKNGKINSNEIQGECNDSCLNTMIMLISCSKVLLDNIEMTNNENYQLISSTNINQQLNQLVIKTDDEFTFTNSLIQSNSNNYKILLFLQLSILRVSNLNYTLNNGNIYIKKPQQIIIQESFFIKNKGQDGGSINICQLSQFMAIKNSQFTENQAIASGGALFFEDSFTQNITINQGTLITKNRALIGGGIRIVKTLSKIDVPYDFPFSQVILNNTADIYGNNACTYIQNILVYDSQQIAESYSDNRNSIKNKLQYEFQYNFNQDLILNQTASNNIGELFIKQFKSGGFLYLNFYFIDEEMRKLSFSKQNLINNIYPDSISQELKHISISIVNNNKDMQLIGQSILNYNVYNEQNNSFEILDLQISAKPSSQRLTKITSTVNKNNQDQLQIILNIEFRKCQIGEVIFDVTELIKTCNFCSQGSYSLLDPNILYEQQQNLKSTSQNKNNTIASQCKKCPDSALFCQGNLIQLRNGYWRKDINSEEILACDEEQNSCEGENDPNGVQFCSEGYIGPLCEECDTLGNFWYSNTSQRYVSSFYTKNCQQCSSPAFQYGFLIFQVVIILFYLIYNSEKFIKNISYVLTCYYLRKLKILPLTKPSFQSQTTSFVKILLTYLQFTSLLVTNPSLLPIQTNLIPNILGSSNSLIILNITCIIPQSILKEYGKLVTHSVLNTVIPILFISLSLLVLFLLNFLNVQRNFRKYIVYTLINIIYIFFLLDIVSFFTQMLTCRKIGSNSYHSLDLTIQCDDAQIKNIIIPYSITMILILSAFPLLFLYHLYKLSNRLEECTTKLKFGYFYLELNKKQYYWEFIRIYLKILTVILYNLLKRQNVILARQIVILVIAYYIKQVQFIKPFISQKLTNMEVYSFQILILKMVFSSLKEEYSFIQIIFDFGIVICDITFFFLFIKNVLNVQIIQNQNSTLGKFIRKFFEIFCREFYHKKLKSKMNVSLKSYQNWKKLSKNLKKIIIKQATLNIQTYRNLKKQQDQQLPTEFNNLSKYNIKTLNNPGSPLFNQDKTNYYETSFSFREINNLTTETFQKTKANSFSQNSKKLLPSSQNTINLFYNPSQFNIQSKASQRQYE